MSLLGPWFLGLVLVLTVLAFVLVLRIWPRWSGPGVRAVLIRAGLLLGVNALVLLTAAVGLNDRYSFYADWTDLAGALGMGQHYSVSYAGGGPQAASQHGLAGTLSATVPSELIESGRVRRYQVTGPISGIRAEVRVMLPDGYDAPANRDRRYPVLEAFQGYPGVPFVPLSAVQDAVRAHRLADTIIVSPSTEIPPGQDSECVDGPGRGQKVETWLAQDLPNWAAQTFRTLPQRSGWATLGWSAGGWCAAMTAMLHADRFSAAIVLGGYFHPDFGSGYVPFAPNSAAARRYDLVALAGQHPPPVALWMQTSRLDELSYPSSVQLLAAARAPLSVQSLLLEHAGHRISVWESLLPQALAWLGRTVPGFAPGGAAVPAAPGTSVAPATSVTRSARPGPGPLGSGLPGAGLPGAGLPGAGLPGAGLPGTGLPGTGLPGTRLGGPARSHAARGLGRLGAGRGPCPRPRGPAAALAPRPGCGPYPPVTRAVQRGRPDADA